LWSWGNNSYGQLGLGNLVNRSSPVQIGALNYWTQINSGQLSTLAVQSNGTLWAWGNNTNGVLGLNTSTIQYSSPVQVGTQSYYVRTSIADGYKCFASAIIASPATNSIGALFLAGSTETSGINNTSSPIQLFGVSTLYSIRNWTQIAAGNAHWLAIQSPGTLWACGYNGSGQLGNNTSSTSIGASTPIQIGLLNSWSQVAGGNFASYAIRVPGTLWAWGYNVQGQLGQGNTVNYSSPVQIGFGSLSQKFS
jgi:alpha-tubulin suppressor-like RCC1 family protein